MKDNRFSARDQRWRQLSNCRRSSLHSLRGLHVWISGIEEEAAREGLDRERMKAEVEWRLAAAGIPVLHHQERAVKTPAVPCLGILIHLRQADVSPPFFIFSIEMFFIHTITSGEPFPQDMNMAWCQEAIGDVQKTSQGADWGSFYNCLGKLVDAFIADYLLVNHRAKASMLIN
ncbi:MAG: hypothetical protein QME75_04730 [Deltaproteobacteria bacterium]|nr:hypothetical protein [Deltaproteobacteria bacterium]